jgi:hypothetical protein
MPIRRALGESRSFDPKAVAILLVAYDGLVAELGLQAAGDKEKAARIILRLALGETDLDAENLRAAAADVMLNEGAATIHS